MFGKLLFVAKIATKLLEQSDKFSYVRDSTIDELVNTNDCNTNFQRIKLERSVENRSCKNVSVADANKIIYNNQTIETTNFRKETNLFLNIFGKNVSVQKVAQTFKNIHAIKATFLKLNISDDTNKSQNNLKNQTI